MNNNIETFISLYNELDDVLRQRYQNFNKNESAIIKHISKLKSSTFFLDRQRGNKLDMVRALRNVLVHELDMNSSDMISVSDSTISFLSSELNKIVNPLKTVDIMTGISKLYFAKKEDNLKNVIDNMAEKGFTQVPVLSSSNCLDGVISPNSLYLFIAKDGFPKTKPFNELTINDLYSYLKVGQHVSETYCFLSRNDYLDKAIDQFEDCYNKGKRLAAIFVTENGKEEQKILGMITPHDIINSIEKR